MTAITYYPTDEEAAEGIGPWTVEVPEPSLEQQHPGMAEFELDRIARLNAHYAQLRTRGSDAVAALNGSIGSTAICMTAAECGAEPVNVSRGAW